MKRLSIFLCLLVLAVHAPLARAQGAVVVRPYWSFRTEAPVNHIQSGDIDGDGTPEVVFLTTDNRVYVLDNAGAMAWQHDTGLVATDLLVADLDGDDRTAEIFVGGRGEGALFSETEKPAWYWRRAAVAATLVSAAADLNGDARPELITGGDSIVAFDLEQGSPYPTNWPCPEIRSFTSQPVRDLWLGDLEGDGRLEVLPSVRGDDTVYVLRGTNFDKVWQQPLDSQVGLVQAGDLDGDGQAEVVALTTRWQIMLLSSQGRLLGPGTVVAETVPPVEPVPGQLLVDDLNGDGRAEILVLTPGSTPTLSAFGGDGRRLWRHRLAPNGATDPANRPVPRLLAGDLNGDGQAEIIVAARGAEQLYLLTAKGDLLAAYRTPGAIRAVDYADLNEDGWGEIMVGTDLGVQVFGTSDQVVWQERWRTPALSSTGVYALSYGDLDNDGRSEVVAGVQAGWVFALADDGRVRWDLELGAPVVALEAGDVDGDGRAEIAVGSSLEGGQLHLLVQNRLLWTKRVGAINGVVVRDLDGDGRAEIIARAGSRRGAVFVFDGEGRWQWQRRFDEAVTAIGSSGGPLLVGTASGRVYRLAAPGVTVGEYELGAEILSFGEGLAVTTDGKLYRLDRDPPTLLRDLKTAPGQVQTTVDALAVLREGQISLIEAGAVWPVTVDERVTSLAIASRQRHGQRVIVAGTERGRVHLFGLTLDQPPLLTQPDLAETRDGYVYSVTVNDPDANVVNVALEIWDPSAKQWQSTAPQTIQEPGRLNWPVPAPFDTWDSGQESRFRFRYDDGRTERLTAEMPGPLTIPTSPWYAYYGRQIGLAALLLAVPVLGWLFYRRQRAYRRSPVGRAESLFHQLQAEPSQTLSTLHQASRVEPAVLTHLSGLAGDAGEPTLAGLSEGCHLLLTRPDMAEEGLRLVTDGLAQLPEQAGELSGQLSRLYAVCRQALAANTVSRLIMGQAQWAALRQTLSPPHPALAEVAPVVSQLEQVVQALYRSQLVEPVEDKVAYLAQAIERLGRLDREVQARLPQPERHIFSQWISGWLSVTTNALQELQGRAQLELSLKTHQLPPVEPALLALQLTNTGRSPAANVAVRLLPGPGYKVINGAIKLANLPAGGSTQVEIPISTLAATAPFRAEFSVTYDDPERHNKSLAFADLIQVMQPVTEFKPIPNPYIPGTPLQAGSPLFFGRADLFQFVAENMAGSIRQSILVLIGQRRMGKTSFLQQLAVRLSRDYVAVYLDGQALGIDPGMANFFYDVALAISDALARQGMELAEPSLADFEARPSGAFERVFLPAVFEAIRPRQLLLLFDEFEELEMRVKSGRLAPAIFSYFRHLMQHTPQVGFIFVGTHRLEALSADYWSIFFNIALYKHVAFLDEAAARALVVEPVAPYGLRYDELALDKILRVTAGHPYFLQLLCHALVNRANRQRRGYLTIQDVNDGLGELVELGEAHFAFLWEQSSPAERLILAALTQLLSREATVTALQLVETLAERGLTVTLADVTESLRRLLERDLVREISGKPPRYEFKVVLLRLWLERYKTLGRVLEENA